MVSESGRRLRPSRASISRDRIQMVMPGMAPRDSSDIRKRKAYGPRALLVLCLAAAGALMMFVTLSLVDHGGRAATVENVRNNIMQPAALMIRSVLAARRNLSTRDPATSYVSNTLDGEEDFNVELEEVQDSASEEEDALRDMAMEKLASKCSEGTALFDRVASERFGTRIRRMSSNQAEQIASRTLIIQSGEIKFPACFQARFNTTYNVNPEVNMTGSEHLAILLKRPEKVWFFANAFDVLHAALDIREKGKLKDRKLMLFTDRIFTSPRSQWRIKTQSLVGTLKVPRATLLDVVFVPVPVYIFKYAARVPQLGQKMLWVPNWVQDDFLEENMASMVDKSESGIRKPASLSSERRSYIAGVTHVRLKSKETTDVFLNITKAAKDTRLVAIEKDWGPVRRAVEGMNITLRIGIGGVRTNGLICKGVANCEEIYTGDPDWPGLKDFYHRSLFGVVSVSKWAPRSHGRVSTGRGLRQLQIIQASGKALVITETSNWVGYLSSSRDALVVDSDDYGPMKGALRKLLKNPGMMDKLGSAGMKRAMNLHGSMVTERFLSIIAAMTKGGRNWGTPWQPKWKISWRSLLKESPIPLNKAAYTYHGKPWVTNTDSIYKEAGVTPKHVR